MRSIALRALPVLVACAACAQPRITRLQNNYSYILPGMPNYGIAQGSIFDIFGAGLAAGTSPLQGLPLSTSISGTSASITVNGVTTNAILYFASPTQIAAILPSATPVGAGQITVTFNGQTSPAAPITVVQTAFGLLTLNGAGNGPAAVFDLKSQYLGLNNAANPGDFITLWGSGLGPVSGDETVAQAAVDLAAFPIEVDIGGKAAVVQYHGRSLYPGLDQINVQVPAGLDGCHISVVVRAGDIVSNFGLIPVAPSGRVCSDAVEKLTAAQVQSLMAKSTITRGVMDFSNGFQGSSADATFVSFTNAQYAAKQPGGYVSMGDCRVDNYTNINFAVANPIKGVSLDAGPAIVLSTPSGAGIGQLTMPFQDGSYAADTTGGSGGGLKGTYTFSGSGGVDIGAFSAQISFAGGAGSFNAAPLGNATSVVRQNGLTVTWTQPSNSDPNEYLQISGYSFVPNAPNGAEFGCNVPLAPGRFTIPPAVLLALPPWPSGVAAQASLEVDLVITQMFTAPGMDIGVINFALTNPALFSYQ